MLQDKNKLQEKAEQNIKTRKKVFLIFSFYSRRPTAMILDDFPTTPSFFSKDKPACNQAENLLQN